MNKTELLQRLARDGEERLLLARALDKLELARDRGAPAHTGFLSPHERALIENGLIPAAGLVAGAVVLLRRRSRKGSGKSADTNDWGTGAWDNNAWDDDEPEV